MARTPNPSLSTAGEAAVAAYARSLREDQDLSVATRRNYLSDLRLFAGWCEGT